MHEVLTVSLSQSANHLTTHFYNAQESYIDYNTPLSKQTNKINDESVHFKPTISATSVNYTPRALIWDLNGGFGALSQFEYFQGDENQQQSEDLSNHQTIAKEKITKNEYQKALDEGRKPNKLTNDSVKYWSDYSRVIFEPKSYNVLQNWEFDPVKYPKGRLTFGKEREFVGYDIGLQEFKNNEVGLSFMEDKYRVSLEECDLLNGINIVGELDSAWSGFGAQILDVLRDDYNPKSEIFSHLLYNGNFANLSHHEAWDRIKSFLKYQKESSLVIPLNKKLKDVNSPWEVSAIQNVAFESLQVLSSQIQDRKSFHEIESSLSLGNEYRNIVSKVEWTSGDKKVDLSSSFFATSTPSKREAHSFSNTKILRASEAIDYEEFVKQHPYDLKDRSKTQFFSKVPYPTPDSYPEDVVSPENSVQVELGIESNVKKSLIEMKNFVSKYIRGDERTDAIDTLSTLAQEYEHGFDDSDEESDDDY